MDDIQVIQSGKREPTYLFLCKALLITAILIGLGTAFFTRYYIGHDFQTIRCIEKYSTYLVDRMDRNINRGSIYVFQSKDLRPFFEPGTRLTKYLVGLPGDTIEIDENDEIRINGTVVGKGLSLAKTYLNREESDFRGKRVLQENEYWVMGDSENSFDSRYWGSIKIEDIVAKAYPLF